MSSEALPISPARFAEAIKDLTLQTLHLKVLEIRNDIAHLEYSNEQLRPYAEGTAAVLGSGHGADGDAPPQPDPDCVDAIRENLVVIARKHGQLDLVRTEVESRGASWTEFLSKEEVEQAQALLRARAQAQAEAQAQVNGTASHEAANGDGDITGGPTAASTTGNPWTDGTFQTGTIRNGVLQMDPVPAPPPANTAGRLTDDELRRALEARLGSVMANGTGHHHDSTSNDDDNNDEDDGLHL
ncbi:hypothetical protein SPI_05311 [Niveomyces insectorum RCEF 264]|uniref:Secondary alcohol dehydrogenase n=1 Tax=Niveomyces insectorum RCEF 264 TaxID=1081102 RepID=A0A167U6G1_9HYPO|nr:hypothetical protein SPI_05311 [Niveomyces insectorum RCEF 264]